MICEHKNSAGLAFCRQCGAHLTHRLCSNHHVNPDDALFCGQCGEDLSHRTQDDSSISYQRFDLRQMQQEAEEDEHQSIVSKEMVSQEDIRRLLEKRRNGR